MSQCIFCKISAGEIPTNKVYEDEHVIGFKDLHPQAANHFLFIHKNHSKDLEDMMEREPAQVQDIFRGITTFTKKEGLHTSGYRVVNNIGPHGGQTVFHTHFHLLGGEALGHFGK